MEGDSVQSPSGDEATPSTPAATVRPVRTSGMASDPRDTPKTPDSASSTRSLGRGISSLMLNENEMGGPVNKEGEAGEVDVEIERAVAMDADDDDGAADANDPSRSPGTERATPTRGDESVGPHEKNQSPHARPEDVSDEVDALVAAAVDKGVGVAAHTLKDAMVSARTVEGGGGHAADAMARALADSLLARMMPGSAAVNASIVPVGDDTCADVSSPGGSMERHDDAEMSVVEMSESASRCSPRAVLLAAEVLTRMPTDSDSTSTSKPGPRLRLIRGVFHALRARMGNCLGAAKVGVFPALVRALADHIIHTNDDESDESGPSGAEYFYVGEEFKILRRCARLVAAHHMPVGHLRMWLATCASLAGPGRGVMLHELDAALALPQSRGPSRMFQLDGENSGVLGASVGGPWPFNDGGFAVVTWVYLETTRGSDDSAAHAAAVASHAAASSGHDVGPAAAAAAAAAASGHEEDHMPRLFSFVSAEDGGNAGVEAYFHGRYLVLEATGGSVEAGGLGTKRTAKVAAPFTHAFKLKRWTCVGVEYSAKGTQSEARLYIDGVPVETRRVTLPHVYGSLGFCCVGTNPPAAMAGLQRRRRQCSLFGALGPVYVFNEPIGARHVSQLSARGGTYVPGYGTSTEGGLDGGDDSSSGGGGGANTLGGKKIARGFQLANAAAKAVVKAASDGVKKIDQRAARGLGLTSAKDGDDGDGEETNDGTDSVKKSGNVNEEWARLDLELAPALLQLMHPAAASAGDASLPGDRRVPDLSPANMGGRGDRNGSLLGSAKVVTRAPPRESLWAVAPGGPAALLPLACPALCSQTFTPRRLRADGKDERARRVAAAAAAIAPALGVLARAGDGGADVATLDALAAVDAPRLIALVLPSALDAMRRVHASSNGGSQHGHGGVNGGTGADWVDCILGAETSLDVAEVAVVEALERLLEAARDHRTLRRQLCTHLFLSFEPWTGGGGVDGGGGVEGGGGVGVGAPAMRRVIRAVAASSHAEGGAALRELCGVTRLLDSAATYLSPTESAFHAGALNRLDGDAATGGSAIRNAFADDELEATSTAKGSVRDAATEDKLALMDELVAAVSTLVHGGQSHGGAADETATALVGFLSGCKCPHLCARVVSLSAGLCAAPNADRAEAFTRAFVRAGGVEVCLALIRAASLNQPPDEPESSPDDVRHFTPPCQRLQGYRDLVASCVRTLGRLVARGEAEVAGATSALIERAVCHCLRRAPTSLLSENVYDAAMRAALDNGGAVGPTPCLDTRTHSSDLPGENGNTDRSSRGADAFAREISLSASPVRLGSPAFGILGAALSVIHRAPLDTRRRCVRDHFALACAHADNRSAINASPEWPAWLVMTLSASTDDEEITALGGDLLDVQARHAMRRREGWRVVESVIVAFREVSGEVSGSSSGALNRMLINLAAFAGAELRGSREGASGSIGGPLRKKGGPGHKSRVGRGKEGGSFGSKDFGETSLDELLRLDPAATTRDNATALMRLVLDHLRTTWTSGGDSDLSSSSSLPLLRASLNAVELLVNSDGSLGQIEGGVDADAPSDVDTTATRHSLLCLALATAREEANALDDEGLPGANEVDEKEAGPVVPASVADAVREPSRVSPVSALAFESRAMWGVGADTPLGRAMSAVHHITAFHLRLDGDDDAAPAMAAIGALYDEVRHCARAMSRTTESRKIPSHARAVTAYLLALVGRWREHVIAECSTGESRGTLESAAAASAALGDPNAVRDVLSTTTRVAINTLCTAPWSLALGSPAIAARLAEARDGVGDGEDALGPRASRSRSSAAAHAYNLREESRLAFERSWEDPGGSSSEAAVATGTAGVAARWRRLGYDAASRRSMASAAHRAGFRNGTKAWRVYAECLLDSNALFARLLPPNTSDDDPGGGWTHSALCVGASETARRRRYRLRMSHGVASRGGTSPAAIETAKTADGGGSVVAAASSEGVIEDQKPRLPFTGRDFGDEPDLPDAEKEGEVDTEKNDELNGKSPSDTSAARVIERDHDMMIAAAAAAAAAAALGKGEESGSLILQCDAELVTPTGVASGRLLVTTRDLTFQQVKPSKGDDEITSDERTSEDPNEDHNTFAPPDDDPHAKEDPGSGGIVWRWPLDSLRGVQTRRYLLRGSAIEIFLLDRRAYFLDLKTQAQRTRVYSTVAGLRPKHCGAFLEIGNSSPEALFRRSDITARWCRREMSNFDYIMALNTLAGRTYNDITQYPVFPWVIADYESEVLDLTNPRTYRDLGKPVGALSERRLERIKERYDAFDDPEIPKFHYGSHYSSAGIVLFYLLRLEPFTTLAHQLQGGKFDLADRLFNDVSTCWRGVLSDMSDVKELIPEFYYLPEMFVNVNGVEFGVKQSSGTAIDDCGLPPWAADAFDFVHKNRAALESEHVSKNLHKWIDLVFGCKQRGPAAVRANNVFYYLTYEGNVDMEAIDDPTLLKATQAQIANFGQTPSQLTRKPHPRRIAEEDTLGGSFWLLANPARACRYPLQVPRAACGGVPAAHLAVAPERAVVVTTGASPRIVTHRWLPNTPDASSTPFTFASAKETGTSIGGFFRSITRTGITGVGAQGDSAQAPVGLALVLEPDLAATLRRAPAAEKGESNGASIDHSTNSRGPKPRLPCEVTPDGTLVVIGGCADGGVRVFDAVRGGAPLASSRSGHVGAVTALALSVDGGVLVTAAADSSLAVWTLHNGAGSDDGIHGGIGGGGSSTSRDSRRFVDAKVGSMTGVAGMGGSGVGVSMGDAVGKAMREAERHPATGAARGYAPREHHAEEQSVMAAALARHGELNGAGRFTADEGACVREARARAGVTGGVDGFKGSKKKRRAPAGSTRTRSNGGEGNEGTLRGPHFIMKGHGESVAACAVSTDLAVVLATSPRFGSTFHCLLTGRFLRAVPELRGEYCALSPEGVAMAWERRHHALRVATLNGDVVRGRTFRDDLPPFTTPPLVSSDGKFVVLGTERASKGDPKPAGVVLLEVPSLRVAHVWELPGGAGVSAMTLTGDNTNLLVSGTDGSLTVLADPRLGMRLVSQMFNLGWAEMA